MNAIEITNLVKKYGYLKAVNNVSLNIKQGELFSLLGVNGAGKSTIIKILTGVSIKDGGKIIINGNDIDSNFNKEEINVSPQETAVAPNLSVKENLEFMKNVYRIKDNNIISKLIKDFKLESVMNKKAKTLSGGYQRRLSIAMALINSPKILFLDEPTLGLDVLARRDLWKIIKSLKDKVTIILTTHYMEEAENLSDRIGIMVDGTILEVDTLENILKKYDKKNLEEAFIHIASEGGSNENN